MLKQALEETERVAIAKIALRDREHLCALESSNGFILLNTLNWPDEIRSTEGLKGLDSDVKINPKELAMAKVLIESLADEFDPARYRDDYHEALMKVVEAKLEGKVVEGHKRGEAVVLDVARGAIELGVKWISLYAFSTENWKRSPDEVRFLMNFNRDVIHRRVHELDALGVRVRWAGRLPRLWRSVVNELKIAEQRTKGNDVRALQNLLNRIAVS